MTPDPARTAGAPSAATGEVHVGYPDEQVVTEPMLDADRASLEVRQAPIFRDPPGPPVTAPSGEGAGR